MSFAAPIPPYFAELLEKLNKIYGVNLDISALTKIEVREDIKTDKI